MCFQVVFALRELSSNVDLPVDMCVACSFCNERFSTNILYQVMVRTLVSINNKTYLIVINDYSV